MDMPRDSQTILLQVDKKRTMAFGLVMLLIMLIITLFSAYRFLRLQKNEENRLAGTIGTILSEAISRISFSGKYHSRLLLEEMQKQLPELAYISVENLDGRIEAHSNDSLNDTLVNQRDRELSRQAVKKGEPILLETMLNGKAVKEVRLPYRAGVNPEPAGVVRIGIRVDQTRGAQRKNLFINILMIFVLTGSAVWIMQILGRHFNRRLTQAEEALRESEYRYRSIVENIPDTFYRTDLRGRLILISPSGAKLLGYDSTEEMLGRSIESFWLHPEKRGELLERLKQGGVVRDYEVVLVRKDGSPVEVSTTTSYYSDQAGRILGVEGVVRDVTDVKQREKEKLQLENQLQQALKMEAIGQLAGGVAHDFNNMLGVIIGFSDLILAQEDSPQRFQAELEEIRNAALRSADLTRQLLTFARKQTVAPRVLDLNQTVEGMLNMLRRLIGENIKLIWKPGADLWPIHMDPSQLDQILANLCVNARDAIAGVGSIFVETENTTFGEDYCKAHPGATPGEYVQIAVSDTGCGMDQHTLSHIFEPFFTTKGVGKGTGLGLATVFGAVKQNHGYIHAYSELGRGTTVLLYIPRYLAAAAPPPAAGTAEPIPRGHEVIVLAEDEPAVLHMTQTMLESLGYTVLAADTPSEAIRQVNAYAGQIHLLATDVIMPEMNGRELAERLLESRPTLKCLFMSGYTANIIANQGVLQKGVPFIHKPFTIVELAVKVREALQ